MNRARLIAATLLASGLLATTAALPADAAAPKPKSYVNCTALNKVYPHGVGKKGAVDKTTGKKVTNYKVDNTVYSYNDGGSNRKKGEKDLDRDNDGIACEKR